MASKVEHSILLYSVMTIITSCGLPLVNTYMLFVSIYQEHQSLVKHYMLGESKQLRMWVGYHSQTYADYISGWKLLLPVSTPLWCKQDVGPRGLRQRLLCNWFSLQQEAGRGGERLVFLPVSNPPPSSAPPHPPLPLHSLYIKPQPQKTRTLPWSNELWERRGGGGRC